MSSTFAAGLVTVVAAIHVAIAAIEIFFWRLPRIHNRLDFNDEEAKKAAPVVANAGLYNSFLAAGLIWGLLLDSGGSQVQLFFLACVAVAGVFGAVTLKLTTLFIQTIPAAIAFVAVWMSRY